MRLKAWVRTLVLFVGTETIKHQVPEMRFKTNRCAAKPSLMGFASEWLTSLLNRGPSSGNDGQLVTQPLGTVGGDSIHPGCAQSLCHLGIINGPGIKFQTGIVDLF